MALLTEQQAAELLQVSQSYLRKIRYNGSGPRFLKLGRLVRYKRSDLMAWATCSTCPECCGEGCFDGEDDWGQRHYAECPVCDGTGEVDEETHEALTKETEG